MNKITTLAQVILNTLTLLDKDKFFNKTDKEVIYHEILIQSLDCTLTQRHAIEKSQAQYFVNNGLDLIGFCCVLEYFAEQHGYIELSRFFARLNNEETLTEAHENESTAYIGKTIYEDLDVQVSDSMNKYFLLVVETLIGNKAVQSHAVCELTSNVNEDHLSIKYAQAHLNGLFTQELNQFSFKSKQGNYSYPKIIREINYHVFQTGLKEFYLPTFDFSMSNSKEVARCINAYPF